MKDPHRSYIVINSELRSSMFMTMMAAGNPLYSDTAGSIAISNVVVRILSLLLTR